MSFSPCSFKFLKISTTSRPATAVEPHQGVLRQDEVSQIFNEVRGAVRCESETEIENPLNL